MTSTWRRSISRPFRCNSIERIEITRGNSGAVLYGDNAVGGVINIVLKNGVGGPPVAMRAEAGVGSFNQRLANHLGGDQLRAVVDLVLRQRHQVRRLSRQQRARPEQRRRQPQLHHARPQGVPDRHRRRPEARLPWRPHCQSLAWASTNWSRTAVAPVRRSTTANQQGASATAGFTKTLWNGVDLIVDGGVRDKKHKARSSARYRCSPLPSFLDL